MRFLPGSHPRAVISLTLALMGLCCLPTFAYVKNYLRGHVWLVARQKGQGAAISSTSAFSGDICYGLLGKLLNRSHTAQNADQKPQAQELPSSQGLLKPQTPQLLHGIQEMYDLNFLSILNNICLKFPDETCQLMLLQISPPGRQGKCRKRFQRCRRETGSIGTSQQQNNTLHFPHPWLSILIQSASEAALQHVLPTSSVCLSRCHLKRAFEDECCMLV